MKDPILDPVFNCPDLPSSTCYECIHGAGYAHNYKPELLRKLWNQFEEIKDIIRRDDTVAYRLAEPIMRICNDSQDFIKEADNGQTPNPD